MHRPMMVELLRVTLRHDCSTSFLIQFSFTQADYFFISEKSPEFCLRVCSIMDQTLLNRNCRHLIFGLKCGSKILPVRPIEMFVFRLENDGSIFDLFERLETMYLKPFHSFSSSSFLKCLKLWSKSMSKTKTNGST